MTKKDTKYIIKKERVINLKKTIALISALMILISGCASDKVQNGSASDTAPATHIDTTTPATSTSETTCAYSENKTPTEESTPTEEESQHETHFKPGIWSAVLEDIPFGYFLMYEDSCGATIEYEAGIGIAFDYELGINEVTFHYGSSDDNTHYTIESGDPAYVVLVSDTGERLVLQHISDDTDISFTTNEELALYAREYYHSINGETPPSFGTKVNPDGTVTIQLYESLSDHNSTWAWYTVDRETGEGTDDISGERIDIIP